MFKILFLLTALIFSKSNISAVNLQDFKNWFFDKTYLDDEKFRHHRLEIESGLFHVLYNNIGNNSLSGSLFNTSSIQNNINFYARFSYYFNLDKKNTFKILIAPFSTGGFGNLNGNFSYGGQNFTSSQFASYNYKFNSYRLTYRRTVFENKHFKAAIGITFKIRDAMINLTQGTSSYTESNIGFVPLAHLNLEYYPIEKFGLIFEGDLAAAPQGRAFDLALSARYDIRDYLDFSIGYRMLEGGAINKNVYNMAFVNYYFLALGVKF